MTAAAAPAFAVHCATTVETHLRFDCGAADERAPWPLTLALDVLRGLGVEQAGRFDARGRGRGLPLWAHVPLRWRDLDAELEMTVVDAETVELGVVLPPWDELVAAGVDEESLWELADAVAERIGAQRGAVLDGESLTLRDPGGDDDAWIRTALRRHLAVLVDGDVDVPAHLGARYRTLERSGVEVLLH